MQGFFPDQSWPVLARGSKGDEVVWLQEHLASYDSTTPLSGVFDANTDRVLRSLQANRGLPATGSTDPATWQAVLSLTPVAVDWTTHRTATSASGRHAPPPRSARLPARRDEIPRVG